MQNLTSWFGAAQSTFLNVTGGFELAPPEQLVCPVTTRLLAMDFPVPAHRRGDKPPRADERVAQYFERTFGAEHVMVWNLSETSYEGLSALEFRFPGHPSAPLGALFELCASLDSWLDAKSENVAAIHCATGRGRTLTVIACYLAWSGHAGMTPRQALEFACEKKGVKPLEATIPSQRRYCDYFALALEGIRPRPEPIVLRSCRVRGVPADSVLQIYVDGALVKSAFVASIDTGGPGGNGTVVLEFGPLDTTLDGDVLIRVRHEDRETKTRISLFRVALHTGYVPSGVLRLTEAELDGGKPSSWMEFDFVARTDRGATSPQKISKGVATSEGAFWELIARRRAENRRKAADTGGGSFSIHSAADAAGNRSDSSPTRASSSASPSKREPDPVIDDLEAELGDILGAQSAAPTPGGKATANATNAKTPAQAEDDLDELEEYLKGIGPSS